MRKGVYRDSNMLCYGCNQRTTLLCSACHQPCCEKHAFIDGAVIGCRNCKSATNSFFTMHAAVNMTPLWWDILFFRFEPTVGGYKAVRREQFKKTDFPNPRTLLNGAILEEIDGLRLRFHETKKGFRIGTQEIAPL